MAENGTTKPIIVIMRPNDYQDNSTLSFYGFVSQWSEYRHEAGDFFAGGFTMKETL
jgi:hypothetical protein